MKTRAGQRLFSMSVTVCTMLFSASDSTETTRTGS